MEERVIAAMEAGETVVTATRRLARAWRQAYAEHQQAAGRACWDTPSVLPWDAWLQTLWEEAQFAHGDGTGALLSRDQVAAVWQRVIADSDLDLMDVSAAARGADEAWRLLHAWDLDLPGAAGHWGEDVAAFVGWAEAFRRECRRHGWLDPARLPDRLAEWIGRGELPMPAAVTLAGFDELTPQQARLLEAAAGAGVRVVQAPLPDEPGTARRVTCHDDEDELARAAGWARRHLESRPEARIAVVVPALAARRAHVRRVFDDVLQPRALLADASPRQPAYNMSLGRPLSAYPLVRAALRVLDLLAGRSDLAELGALLRSPFVTGGDREAPGRAALDARLRRRGEPVVWLVDVLQALRSGSGGDEAAEAATLAPDFAQAVQRLFVHQREAAGRRLPGDWAMLFSRALQTSGWPGERGLDSAEYQQLRAWEELLDRFAGLDAVAGAMDRPEALAALRRLAADTVFQPRTPARRLQVVGPLEALGQRFDHVWIAGLDDDIWPPPPRPNPWLPASLQREHGLPHASAAREREYTGRLTAHLLATAPDVVVSHARWDGDRERAASPLVAGLPELEPALVAEADIHLLRNVISTADTQERIQDLAGPPLAAQRAPGGAGALGSQAACPMQAFGRYRLQARALERPRLGVDARERGQLLHRALELFFARHDSAAALAALGAGGRESAARACAETAVAELARRRPRTFTERFRAIETDVLAALLVDWLAVEAQRSPFRVQAREWGTAVTLAGAEFRVKLDRVDELADGRRLVVDYKTGRVGSRDWDGERPRQPQLPLYALTQPEGGLAGVAFACIRPGTAGFAGCVEEGAELPGVKPEPSDDWCRRLREWRIVLGDLAAAYVAGAAAPDPRGRDVCDTCDLHGLCRIAEIRAERGVGDGDDEVEAA